MHLKQVSRRQILSQDDHTDSQTLKVSKTINYVMIVGDGGCIDGENARTKLERRDRRVGSSLGRLCDLRRTDLYGPLSALLHGVSYMREEMIRDGTDKSKKPDPAANRQTSL